MLWYAVMEDEQGYHVTYRSVMDKSLHSNFHYFNRNDSLLMPYRQQHEVQQLITFSQGYYTTQYYNDTLVFNDLRFGQVTGCMNPANRFAFYYYLQQPDNNQLLIQRGRFANWDAHTLRVLWRRMREKNN
jgi:inner membrane protein